jgi:hypothetical protein
VRFPTGFHGYGRFTGMTEFSLSHSNGFRRWWHRSTDVASPGDIVAEIAYLEQCGAVVTLRGLPEGALFEPGHIYIPEAAIRVLEASGQYAWPLLLRHVEGEWGTLGRLRTTKEADVTRDGDRMITGNATGLNLQAIRVNEGRVVSTFETANGDRLCIITHLGEGGYTTFLVSGGG